MHDITISKLQWEFRKISRSSPTPIYKMAEFAWKHISERDTEIAELRYTIKKMKQYLQYEEKRLEEIRKGLESLSKPVTPDNI